MSDDCLFCRVVRGDIPAEVVFRTPSLLAIRDIGPQAPTHVLVIPIEHVASLDHAADGSLLGEALLACREVAARERLSPKGYRIVVNTGPDAGQSVEHLHFHVLGGRAMGWPPG